MTSATVELDPACPEGSEATPTPTSSGPATRSLVAVRQAFDTISPATWDGLADCNPWATPFARWAFHRAWWDGYGGEAHDQTIVVVDPAEPAGGPIGIVPLMHRHAVTDPATRTVLRHGPPPDLIPVEPTAKAVFFGASYHADYATVLAAPSDLPTVAEALAVGIAAHDELDPDHPAPWDVVDLRRLRCGDPAAEALAAAFSHRAPELDWVVDLEREDVCPVTTVPADTADLEGFLATLGKKDRHEIRRKLRRAEAAGPVRLTESADPLAELDAFIDLHQSRWGADGLFPPTAGGDASRRFVRRLFETFGPAGAVRLCFLSIGGRRVGAGITFEAGDTIAYYNAGMDPAARDLSPGVVMIATYVQRAIETGRHRLDFLRGNEAYKYEWGAADEPIRRLLVRRTDRR